MPHCPSDGWLLPPEVHRRAPLHLAPANYTSLGTCATVATWLWPLAHRHCKFAGHDGTVPTVAARSQPNLRRGLRFSPASTSSHLLSTHFPFLFPPSALSRRASRVTGCHSFLFDRRHLYAETFAQSASFLQPSLAAGSASSPYFPSPPRPTALTNDIMSQQPLNQFNPDRYVVIHVATTCDEHGVYVTKDSAEVIEIGWILVDANSLDEVRGCPAVAHSTVTHVLNCC